MKKINEIIDFFKKIEINNNSINSDMMIDEEAIINNSIKNKENKINKIIIKNEENKEELEEKTEKIIIIYFQI